MSTYDKEYNPSDYDEPLKKETKQMNITILSVDVKTVPTAKGSYQTAEVAYKNNTFQGKVEGKKIMSFGASAGAFKTLITTTPGTTYELSVVKNDKGYNDWITLTPAGAAAPEAAAQPTATGFKAAGAAASPRSTYETPEERAAKQVYIVKQSSLSAAINTLSVGAKKLEPTAVIALAQEYTDFVFGKPAKGATGFGDLPDFPEDEFPEAN